MQEIRLLAVNEKKAIRHILLALPEWFGLPDSLEDYVKESRELPVLGCYDAENLLGFITLKPTSKETIELYVLGVLPNYHRQGIGKRMIKEAVTYAKAHGYTYMQVKTLAPQAKDDSYLKTYAFYRSLQFMDVEVLPLWDEWNPCLLMICKIDEVKC